MASPLTHLFRPVWAAVVGLSIAVPASAQEVQVPEGCTAFLTVQSKQCKVSVYWRCAEGPEDHTYEASYDGDGPVSVALFDKDFQWLDRQYITTGRREYLKEATDPASMSELLETGRDEYDFVVTEDGADASVDVRHVGFDELSGRKVEIDGVELLETLFASTATNAETGEVMYQVAGQQFVLAEERLFFLGNDTYTQEGRQITSDGSPVLFHRPGEFGFGQPTPLYECGGNTDIGYRP